MLTGLMFFICFKMQGQNLVPNFSFETYSTCPTSASQLTYATGWSNSRNSCEYLNSCSGSIYADVPTNYFGFQVPATGQAYAGALQYGSFSSSYLADLREYLYVPLTTPLTIGTTYYVSFKVCLADNSKYAINNIGAQFTTSYNSNFPINNMAHVYNTSVISDKTQWTTIIGSFIPATAYTAVMLGNFFTDASCAPVFVGTATDIGYNAYYFFDDVYVGLTIPLDIKMGEISARNAGTHNMVNWTSLAEDDGDYFEIERSMDGQSYVKIATIAGRYKTGGNYQFKDERPATGINYYRLKIITKNGNSSYSKVVNLRVKEGSFVLETYPNPVTNLLTVTSSGMVHGAARLSIMDASGKLVRSLPHTGSKTVIPIQGLAAGYYLLHYQDDVTNENRKIVKK